MTIAPDRQTLLTVEGLTVEVDGSRRMALLRDVSFHLDRGEVLAVVGESGSGKSTACLAVAGLLGSGLTITSGSIRFDGRELVGLDDRSMRRILGTEIGLVLQDPTAALNPVRRIGSQLSETRKVHNMGFGGSPADWSESMLARLGLPDVERIRRAYPSQLSGGMRQRVCIGIGFSGEPSLVIADEPTTALDVSSQGLILRTLLQMKREEDTSVLLVSHDLHVVRSIADRIVVLYGGRVLESGRTADVLENPQSQYTARLLESVPRLGRSLRDQTLPTISGSSENAWSLPGCPFAPRCDSATDVCHDRFPDPSTTGSHTGWCWHPPVAPVRVRQSGSTT